ncbi:phosphatase PAP2 family protein [Paenibacillus peoriae]|uniref:phosphatase PAP2 family protein n=1 Tax=Paenibacillus peoriae TaxID=59893 RepID=UPI00026C6017|nr:phosphatase PAP2 family protein [Paenibacillus peoriae]MEC0184785.1 phosphatase PAP2 family protein [Paenibacillus peoriae]
MTHPTKQSSLSTWLTLLWLTGIPILYIPYGLLNRPAEHVYSLVTDLDRLTPFVPSFIIPYVLWYPFIAAVLVGLAFKDRATYYRTLLALCGGLVLSYIVYALFQTAVQRPDNLAETGIINRLIWLVYSHDQPFNCFPSIHVLTSYLMLRGARVFGGTIRWAVTAMSILIIASTLLVKQHVLADVVGGILAGELLYRLAGIAVSYLRGHRKRLTLKGVERHVSAE